jgi:hypothetical protein
MYRKNKNWLLENEAPLAEVCILNAAHDYANFWMRALGNDSTTVLLDSVGPSSALFDRGCLSTDLLGSTSTTTSPSLSAEEALASEFHF